jgi:hypothetical protein
MMKKCRVCFPSLASNRYLIRINPDLMKCLLDRAIFQEVPVLLFYTEGSTRSTSARFYQRPPQGHRRI